MKLLLSALVALLLAGCGLSGSGTGDDDVAKVDLDIRDIGVSQISDSSAALSWRTTDDAVGSVLYGTNQNLLGANVRSSLAKEHAVDLKPLQADTEYWYQISASTPLGESVTSQLLSFRSTVSSDLADTTAPQLRNIRVEGITSSSATIRWDTDDRTNGLVRWGPSAFYGNEVLEPTGSYSRTHLIVLGGLLDDAEYHFQVESRNRNSMIAISSDRSFRTTELPSLRITPSDIRVTANQTFDFFLECSGVTNLAGLEFTIVYSP